MSTFDVLAIYNDLHAMPELSEKEVKTSAYIAEKLEELGYEVQTNVGGYGVVGVMKASAPGITLALHADTDALQHVDENGEKYCCHSCGHDANSATLLASAALLKDKIKTGTLKVIFQPAEEMIIGARKMIAAGAVDDVDVMISTHLRPTEELRSGQFSAAVYHGSAAAFEIVVRGVGGHAARPHQCVNPVSAGAAIVQAIDAIRADPRVPYSIKVTNIKADSGAFNAIAGELTMTVDTRAQTNEVMRQLKEKLRVTATSAAAAYGATAEVIAKTDCVGAIYDDGLVKELEEAIAAVAGKENVAAPIVTTGTEDFHFYAYERPSIKTAFLGVGCGLKPGLHRPDMTFHREVMQTSVKIFVEMALKKLG